MTKVENDLPPIPNPPVRQGAMVIPPAWRCAGCGLQADTRGETGCSCATGCLFQREPDHDEWRPRGVPLDDPNPWETHRAALAASPPKVESDLIGELRSLSSSVGAGLAENTTDIRKLVERIAWGVDHIQQVEAKRTADLIEELSKTPKTTWGQVRTAVLNRAGISAPAPVESGVVERVPFVFYDSVDRNLRLNGLADAFEQSDKVSVGDAALLVDDLRALASDNAGDEVTEAQIIERSKT